jgi:hypothetical protein
MKTTFEFRSHLTEGGENLTQPATFLPGQSAVARSAKGFYLPKMNHLPAFGGILTFNPAKNVLAQPLLKGGLQ